MNVLVISVHPDDETLGCGGALLKHKHRGDNIFCVYVTNGNSNQKRIIQELNDAYSFNNTYQLNLPETELDDISLNIIIPRLVNVFNEIKPNIVYIPNRSDIHSDHRKTFNALLAVTKTFRFPFIKRLLMCEIISETDFAPALIENAFIPNVFVDITEFMDKKLNIINIFQSELLLKPLTRSIDSIKALHRYRGSQINVKYAEAFVLLKEIL